MENKKSFNERISYKRELNKKERQQEIADKLLCGEIYSFELTDEETDEMMEYFTQDIQRIDTEIEKVKQEIIKIKKELEG